MMKYRGKQCISLCKMHKSNLISLVTIAFVRELTNGKQIDVKTNKCDKDKFHSWEISGSVLISFHFVLSTSFVGTKFFEF